MKFRARGITALRLALPAWAAGVLTVGLTLAPTPSFATQVGGYTVIGTESASGGYVGGLFGPYDISYLVASDGESSFTPFGSSIAASDGLDFQSVGVTWNQASDSNWTSLGNQTWILPANGSCGGANETYCPGHFVSDSPWVSTAIGTYVIQEPTGEASDQIVLYNDSMDNANLMFYSDADGTVPEPGTLALMGAGLALVGFVAARRRRLQSLRSL